MLDACDGLPALSGGYSRRQGHQPHTGEEIERPAEDDAPLSALVFKIVTDPYVGRLAYFRVYSGKITQGAMVYNSTKDQRERIGRLLRMYADRREDITEIWLAISAPCWA